MLHFLQFLANKYMHSINEKSDQNPIEDYQREIQQMQNAQNIRQDLPAANPIIKRTIIPPQSIFPFIQLPQFHYPSLKSPPQPTFNQFQQSILSKTQQQLKKISSSSPRKIEVFNSNKIQIKGEQQFRKLFQNSLYTYSSRLQSSDNYRYACLNAFQGQSKIHKTKHDTTSQKFRSAQNSSPDEQTQTKYFQSHFQSGNLAFAAKDNYQQKQCYNLLLMRDINTSRCTQWFFFRVQSLNAGKSTLRILNFTKNYSIFENGMKVCYASNKNNYCWKRGCEQIQYGQTNISMSDAETYPQKNYYALSFSYEFQKNQTVYFSYCYPYTYSMLENFIHSLVHQQKYKNYLKLRNIGSSPGGNYIQMITITNFQKNDEKKKNIFITARVHPAETPSSFVCEGMIRQLLSYTEQRESLLDKFIFKIVPMLNPDGVINGSYRCSLAGFDMNRVWNKADKSNHPQIFAIKKIMLEPQNANKIFLFVDLHAHSKKKGVFMYGCQSKTNPYLSRQIPFLLWKNVPAFNYHQCNFSMKRGREGTARLFISKQLDFPQSYTMQHSFCGPLKQRVHFSVQDYLQIGKSFIKTIQRFYGRIRNQIEGDNDLQCIFKELYIEKEFLKVGNKEDAGSSSDEELEQQKNKPVPVIKNKEEQKKQKIILIQNKGRTQKLSLKKLRKITNYQKNFTSGIDTHFKIESLKKIPKNNFITKDISIIATNYKEKEQGPKTTRPRFCASSLTKSDKKDDQSLDLLKKRIPKDTFRYEDQQEQIDTLSNLFLPSLKSASYKKYSRKTIKKNMVHVGRNIIEEAIMKKQEIKSASKRKQIGWKERAISFL